MELLVEPGGTGDVRHGLWLPATRAGWVALRLMGAFGAFLALFFSGVMAGQRGGDSFFELSWLTVTISLAGLAGVGAGVAAGYAVVRRRERSILVFAALAWGLFVLLFTSAEAAGHGAPGPPAAADPATLATCVTTPVAEDAVANSHANGTAKDTGVPGEVLVSFDYTYATHETGRLIDAITVTPFDGGGKVIPGVRGLLPLPAHSAAHVDMRLRFAPAQLARLASFTVCFTGPGNPDLGCARVPYAPAAR